MGNGRYLREFFGYTTPGGPMALAATVGAQTTGNVTILAESDFAVYYMTGAVIQGSVLVQTWSGTIQVNDAGTGRTFWNAPVGFFEAVGDAFQPFPMPFPRRVAASSTLVITLTNSVATITTVRVTFVGYKLRPDEELPPMQGQQ